MQEALRLMPSDEARRVAREAEAVSGTVTPEQYVGAGAVAILAKLRAPVADQRGLLPCPFCGSEAFATFKTGDDDLRRHSVHCKSLDCGGQTRDRHFSEAEAIAAWNRRPALASAPVAGEVLDTYRNMLLEAVHRYGNARAMAEHDIKQRGQISTTVAAILDLLDAAPLANPEARPNNDAIDLPASGTREGKAC